MIDSCSTYILNYNSCSTIEENFSFKLKIILYSFECAIKNNAKYPNVILQYMNLS